MTKPAATPAETEGVIASSIELEAKSGVVATNVLLLPFGEHHGRDGRGPYVLADRAHADAVIAATRKVQGSADLPFDYDHQSFHAQRVGGQAKAAGWIDPASLTVAADGIRGDVAWTKPAEAALAAREYRYHSPYFMVDKASRRITRLVNAGLTNTPNLDLPALASQEPGASPAEGRSMKTIAQLLSATALGALGLTAESDNEAALAAIDQLVEDEAGLEKALASIRTKLGVDDDADEAVVLASIDSGGGEPDPRKFVPIGALKDVQGRLGALEEEKVIATVDAAIEGGKLTPAQRDWAVKLGKKEIGELQSFLGTAPAFHGDKTVTGQPIPEKGKLTDEERAICAQQGLTEEEFLAARDEEEAA